MLNKLKNIFKKNEEKEIEVTDPVALFKLFEEYKNKRDFDKAVYYLELASKYDPENLQYKLILSTLYLYQEKFEKGWGLYELRFDFSPDLFVKQPIPQWDGVFNKDKKIIVFLEQGFGDCFMFSRFLPLLKKHFSWVALCTTEALSPVLTKENLEIDEVILSGTGDVFKYDCYCQLLSLPYLLKINSREQISENYDYLNKKYVKENSEKEKIKVGFCLHGRIDTDYEKSRAFDLNSIKEVFDNEKYEFYSFYTPSLYQETYNEKLKEGKIIENKEMFTDFNKTTQLIKNMDFMITTDTSVAHLAGALGKKTYLLLPKLTDWRWQVTPSDSYWYPSFTLLRQKEIGDWSEVAKNIKKDILN